VRNRTREWKLFPGLSKLQKIADNRIGVPGTVRRRFASAVVWNILASVISRSMVLAAAVGCARILGKTGFGQLGVVQSTANMVGAVAALGLGVTATRYVADLRDRDPERAGRIIGLSWALTAISGSILALLSFFTAQPLASRMLHAPELATPIRIACAMIFLNAMLAFQNGALCGFEAFPALARINFVSGILSLPIVLAGVWRWGVNGAVAGTALSLAVNWWLNERLLRRECSLAGIPIRIRQGFQENRILWTFSVPALISAFSVAPVLWLSSVMIVRSPHGIEQMALFAGADRWRLTILFIPTALFRSVLPMLANMHALNREGYRRVHRTNLLVNMIVVAIPVLAISAFSIPIMNSYGPGFRAGWPILAVLCAGTIPEALNTVLGYPLVITGRMWVRCGLDLSLGALLLCLGAWLIPHYGSLGFAIAYGASYSVISASLYVLTRERRSATALGSGPVPGEKATADGPVTA
jgi:O-antigen/teichoic acid export membrane protein